MSACVSNRRVPLALLLVVLTALGWSVVGGPRASGRDAAQPAAEGDEPGVYTVVECSPESRGAPDAQITAGIGYDARSRCEFRGDDRTLRIASTESVGRGRGARISFAAPPATEIIGVAVDANLRNAGGHAVRLAMADADGREAPPFAGGGQAYDGWRVERWSGEGRARLVLRVECERENCPDSPDLRALMRSVTLKVKDMSPPEITSLSGSLVEGGWLTDEAEVSVKAKDFGSGSAVIWIASDGLVLARQGSDCAILAMRTARELSPCPETAAEINTALDAAEELGEGSNHVAICAQDFAGLVDCESRNALVDSEPPSGAFSAAQPRSDPELIQVATSDATSGAAAGQIRFRQLGSTQWTELPTSLVDDELQARVNSSSYPEGTYEFEASIADVAGNTATTNLRSDGTPMHVEFPLRESSALRARVGGSRSGRTLNYGRFSSVHGLLLDSTGAPIEGEPVTVTEYFGDGALISERVRTVETSAAGEFGSRLPAGPSRRVKVSYAGGDRYLSDEEIAGQMRVRSEASLHLSRRKVRAGNSVTFSGRVGRLGARIPPGGKLIEIQVQERPGRYNTVRQAFTTNRHGRFRFKYRFGRFYTQPARFKFRAKVVREQRWPFLAPVRSKVRSLRIQPR